MVYTCSICQRSFESLKGLNIHNASCKHKILRSDNYFNRRNINGLNVLNSQTDVETNTILEAKSININIVFDNTIKANIPPYKKDPSFPSTVCRRSLRHGVTGEAFAETINKVYNEVIQWRKNLFKVPSGKTGRSFISELSMWLDHFNRSTEFGGIALKILMVLPCLLLQKLSRQSKAKLHVEKLEHRLSLWK